MKLLIALKRFLRSPRVIVGEIVAIAVAGVLGAAIPQAGTASVAQLSRLRGSGPLVTALVEALALDHVFRSIWFLAITVLAAASLSIVVIEQVRRLCVLWTQTLTDAHFQGAPYRRDFERPARTVAGLWAETPRVEVQTRNKLGLAGSPVFHLGLLFVVVAGALRALFAAEGAVDLIEGETLPPTPEAWAAQWPGIWASPVRLDFAVTLDAVRATRYHSGDLRELAVRLSLQGTGGVEKAEVAVNRGLRAPGGRLYLGSDFGPAAVIEWQKDGVPPTQEAVLMVDQGQGAYAASSSEANGLQAHLRTQVDNAGNPPSKVEVRVMGGNALLHAGETLVGDTVSLPSVGKLVVLGLPFWARLRGSRDPSLGLAYAGFVLVNAGAAIMFMVVKVDTCVTVMPLGDRERVFVALKSQRFAPLYSERFERFVGEQGGAT